MGITLHPSFELPLYIFDATYWCRVLAVVGVAEQPTPLPVVWSLDVEARFYVIAPVLLYFGLRQPRLEKIILIIGIIFGYLSLVSGSSTTSLNLAQYSAFFLCGMLHARGRLNWITNSMFPYSISLVVIILLVIAVFPATRPLLTNYREGWTDEMIINQNILLFTLSLLLVPLALISVRWKARKFDRSIGDLAYPLYLCHWIPLVFYQNYEFSAPTGKVAGLIISWGAVAFLTALSYLLIDRPSERLRARFVSSREKRIVSDC